MSRALPLPPNRSIRMWRRMPPLLGLLIALTCIALTTRTEWVARSSLLRDSRTVTAESASTLGKRIVMSLATPSPSPPLHTVDSAATIDNSSLPSVVGDVSRPRSAATIKDVHAILKDPKEAMSPKKLKEGANLLRRVKVHTHRAPGAPSREAISQVLEGPLCVFVPTNAQDEIHAAELPAVIETWSDASTVIFTDNSVPIARATAVAERTGAAVVEASLRDWNHWHYNRVLGTPELRQRGATPDSIRGRGQLSIPLFHWISQLVKRNDPLVQNCKWFMKCDTDTYLRRGLLEREVLNKLDHTKPYHVGVPLNFNTRPYHHTLRNIEFDYNIGGPGYTFSRALMDAVDVDACVRSMTLDPVLLIHDDVATGYCATYHAGASRLVRHHTAASASHQTVVNRLLLGDQLPSNPGTATFRRTACIATLTSIHPVNPNLMRLLREHDVNVRTSSLNQPSMEAAYNPCEFFFIAGVPPVISEAWNLLDADPDLHRLAQDWLLLTAREQYYSNVSNSDTAFVIRIRQAQGVYRRVIGS